jgi:multiple antibiotic resistance protein
MNIASTAFTLFLVLDPFGNMVMFHALLSRVPEEKRQRVLIRELLIAFAILLFFLFAGAAILSTLGIRPATLSISGGILLFLIALGMVFPAKSILHDPGTEEPFIVPLAVPMMAGPSAIALLLLLASKYPDHKATSALAVSLAWAASAVILLVSPWLLRRLGSKGTQALERLMGLLLILIAVQMFLDGVFSGQFSRQVETSKPAMRMEEGR